MGAASGAGVRVEGRNVDPNCVNASNPFHQCADYCANKTANGRQQIRTSPKGLFLFDFYLIEIIKESKFFSCGLSWCFYLITCLKIYLKSPVVRKAIPNYFFNLKFRHFGLVQEEKWEKGTSEVEMASMILRLRILILLGKIFLIRTTFIYFLGLLSG